MERHTAWGAGLVSLVLLAACGLGRPPPGQFDDGVVPPGADPNAPPTLAPTTPPH